MIVEWMKFGNISVPSLLLRKYKNLGLTDTELIFLLQIYEYVERGNPGPKLEELSKDLNRTVNDCKYLIRSLINKKIIIIEQQNSTSSSTEKIYSFAPLWEKLANLLTIEKVKRSSLQEVKDNEFQTSLYSVFEQEFGRPLSPLECETISSWTEQDNHSDEMIRLALKEAVISRKLNIRYIDAILFNWKKNGIHTIRDAQQHIRKYRTQQYDTTQKQKRVVRPANFPNWLEA